MKGRDGYRPIHDDVAQGIHSRPPLLHPWGERSPIKIQAPQSSIYQQKEDNL